MQLDMFRFPLVLSNETDTQTPRQQIPIYYIHTLKAPFCQNRLCACFDRRHDATRTFGRISAGRYLLGEALHLVAVRCETYGHEWEDLSYRGVKECAHCGVYGYCPGCTPLAPLAARPFFCTVHTPTREREV